MNQIFQHILLALDSGKSSQVALQKACDLASKFNSKLTALFVQSDGTYSFEDSIVFLKNFTSSKGIPCDILKAEGSVCKEICRLKKQEVDFDLLIMTVEKGSCFRSFGFKDNKLKMLHTIACPVLSIPPGHQYFGLENILLPIADSPHTRLKVPYAADLAKRFNATIHIYGASKYSTEDTHLRIQSYVRQTERYLAERGIKYTVSLDFGVRVPTAVYRYAAQVKADIVFKVTESEDKGLFTRNYLNQLIVKAALPVFSISSKDNITSDGVALF